MLILVYHKAFKTSTWKNHNCYIGFVVFIVEFSFRLLECFFLLPSEEPKNKSEMCISNSIPLTSEGYTDNTLTTKITILKISCPVLKGFSWMKLHNGKYCIV